MGKSKKKLIFATIYILFSLVLLRIFERVIQPNIPNVFLGRLAYSTFFTIMSLIGTVIFRRVATLKVLTKNFGAGVKAGIIVLVVYTVVMFLGIMYKMDTFVASGAEILMFIGQMLLVGVSEEVFYRAILQNEALEVTGEDTVAGARIGIVIAGLIFGLLHITNLLAGVSFVGALNQVVGAIPMGVIFGIIYFRGKNNLLVPILLHALVDGSSFVGQGVLSGVDLKAAVSDLGIAKSGIGNIISYAVFVAVALFMMRRSAMEKAIKERKEMV